MNKRLKNIADIRTGYQFRGKVVPDKSGDTDVIQIKDIDDLREIDVLDLTPVNIDKVEQHLVQPDDVLFLSRGHRMYATVVPDLVRDTVASSYFFVLRPKNENIYSRYLAWFLNEPYFHDRLRPFVGGTHMPYVARRNFADLSVVIPDLETQKQIVQLNELLLEEARLMDQLKTKKTELIKGVSRKLFLGSQKKKEK